MGTGVLSHSKVGGGLTREIRAVFEVIRGIYFVLGCGGLIGVLQTHVPNARHGAPGFSAQRETAVNEV